MRTATIVKVYPELRNGELIADATVPGGLDALVEWLGKRRDLFSTEALEQARAALESQAAS